jgi:hypothetical protein
MRTGRIFNAAIVERLVWHGIAMNPRPFLCGPSPLTPSPLTSSSTATPNSTKRHGHGFPFATSGKTFAILRFRLTLCWLVLVKARTVPGMRHAAAREMYLSMKEPALKSPVFIWIGTVSQS